ncbi:LOG family protein [Nocardioides antri]|uniref:Rossmann fold nucleotide-binding protein n=1 Tax=Nocardioides antri TaxID=2607659 RepID=A0A5B1LZ65_9ACTN|nr:LOG family protein [Nocardioides antri]KAA1426255.1 Rossmann fold nucleotide-binding protein [Nocardioides antri]
MRSIPERIVVVRDTSPADPGRDGLYEPEELYDTVPYADALDARAYAWSLEDHSPEALTCRALHDEGIDQALGRWCTPRDLVGVMGGHGVLRGSREYADAARLGHLLGPTLTVATGGGPGAMEAANLGASFARADGAVLEEALAVLADVPTFKPSVDAWVGRAQEARRLIAEPSPTLGVPTWHYGHEPSNVFATVIAKYYRNAQREAILLQICDAGIVFLPGAAGTVQEIFQDACENYYADDGKVAPMVLVGRRYWTETLPAWPLLTSLARGRAMEGHLHLVDSVEEAAALFE